jgi:hypothetical protein
MHLAHYIQSSLTKRSRRNGLHQKRLATEMVRKKMAQGKFTVNCSRNLLPHVSRYSIATAGAHGQLLQIETATLGKNGSH